MHPCISQSRERIREALYEKNSFTKMLQKLEGYTGLSRSMLVIFFTVFIITYMIIGYGSELMCTAIIFVFPAYFTLLSIDGTSDAQKKWFAYWIIFTCVIIVEFFIRCFVISNPFYWLIKCLFLVWCCLPIENNGSMLFYNHVIQQLYEFAGGMKGKQRESQESKLSYSEMLDEDYEGTPSEKETMEELIAEKRKKGEMKSTTSFFGKSMKRKKKKKDEGSEDEVSVKSDGSKSMKSISAKSSRSIKSGSIKSATSSIFGSGKQKSFFSKKKKKKEGEEGESAGSDAGSSIIEEETENVPEMVEPTPPVEITIAEELPCPVESSEEQPPAQPEPPGEESSVLQQEEIPNEVTEAQNEESEAQPEVITENVEESANQQLASLLADESESNEDEAS